VCFFKLFEVILTSRVEHITCKTTR